jgi:predicted dehydrogenase
MVTIGLIGAGFMGSTHLAAYEQLQKGGTFKVAAIADLNKQNGEKFAHVLGAAVYGSGDELLQNAEINTVDICLPTFLHYEYAVKAIEKGYNVFVEKPLCLTSKQADDLAALAEKKGVIAMVGQCIRFWDEYVWLKNILDKKVYGNVVSAHFSRLSPVPTWGWDGWLTDPQRSGSAALDLHVHDSDFILYLFGKPDKIKSITNKSGGKYSYIFTICDYKNFIVTSEGTWNLPVSYPFEMYYRFVFEKATVEFSSQTGVKIFEGDKTIVPEIEKACTVQNDNLGGNISSLGGYYNELQYFVTCLSENKKTDRATLRNGAEAVHFVEREKGSVL